MAPFKVIGVDILSGGSSGFLDVVVLRQIGFFIFPTEEARRIARKLEVYYTPKHGSWLDIAEIGINIMTRECLNRRIPSIEVLKQELKAWNDDYDRNPSPVNWQFQAEDSRIKLKSLYPDIEKHLKAREERQSAKNYSKCKK